MFPEIGRGNPDLAFKMTVEGCFGSESGHLSDLFYSISGTFCIDKKPAGLLDTVFVMKI